MGGLPHRRRHQNVSIKGFVPIDEFKSRGINTAVGLGSKEIGLSVVGLFPAAVGIAHITMRHVRNLAVRLEINGSRHACRKENMIPHPGVKILPCNLLYNHVNKLEGRVLILVCRTGLEGQGIQILQISARLFLFAEKLVIGYIIINGRVLGTIFLPLVLAARAAVRQAGCMGNKVLKGDTAVEGRLEVREILADRVVKRNLSFFFKNEKGH